MNPRNKTKLALVKPANEPLAMWNSWCDGLYGAMRVLAEFFNVRIFGYSDHPATLIKDGLHIQLVNNESSMRYWLDSFKPEYVFGWGTAFHNWNELNNLTSKKFLLYAGGAYDSENASRIFDAVVVENESDKEFFPNSHVAFGTNTAKFRELELNKIFPSFYPAAFAKYKRQELWAKAMPAGSLAVGHMQKHEPECFETCIEHGHIVMNTLPMDSIPYLYNQSKGVCLTPERMGGCQRAALEALACNVPVLTTTDSKASEFEGVWACPPDVDQIREAYLQMVLSFENENIDLYEEYIKDKYDEYAYAAGLRELL